MYRRLSGLKSCSERGGEEKNTQKVFYPTNIREQSYCLRWELVPF
jgi:hypothetical protein